MSESEEHRTRRAIEVSHGSVGEFSRSAASQYFVKRKSSIICLFVFLILLCLLSCILLPVFWFASVPGVSDFLKRYSRVRIPIIATFEVVMFVCLFLLMICVMKHIRSRQKRASYLAHSCSGEVVSSTEKRDKRCDSISAKRQVATSNTPSSNSLRQVLEEMPTETVQKVQELAKQFLNSGNGRSTMESRRFSIAGQHKASILSDDEVVFKISVKVLLIGDVNVGKTSIFHRILYDQFSSSYLQTIGADLGFSTLYLSNAGEGDQLSVALQIWDLGGQEQLAQTTKAYLKDSIIIIPVIDITKKNTLDVLAWWLDEISVKAYDPYIVLLLNKADLDDKVVKEDDINQITQLKNIERYEVSAKTGANVMKAFTETVAKALVKETAKVLPL
eukprot:gene15180-16742_t